MESIPIKDDLKGLMSLEDKNDFLQDDALKNKILTFTLGNETYGIPVEFVTEINSISTITSVPEMPDYIRGIINLRGSIIPIMDARIRFRKEEKAYDDRTCVIVIRIGGFEIGLIVDRVSEVITVRSEDLSELPKIGGEAHTFLQNICRLNTKIVLILDCNALVPRAEWNTLNRIGQGSEKDA